MMNINISLDDDFIQLAIDEMTLSASCGRFNSIIHLDQFFETLEEEFSSIQMLGREYLLTEYLSNEGISVDQMNPGTLLVSWDICSWEEADGCLAEKLRDTTERARDSMKNTIQEIISNLSKMKSGSRISLGEELDRLIPKDLTPKSPSVTKNKSDNVSDRRFYIHLLMTFYRGLFKKTIHRSGLSVQFEDMWDILFPTTYITVV